MSARILAATLLISSGLWSFAACGGAVSSNTEAQAKDEGALPDPPPSCKEPTAGSDHHCGINRDQDCCASPLVPGGTYNRMNDARFPATVSPFRMDKFE